MTPQDTARDHREVDFRDSSARATFVSLAMLRALTGFRLPEDTFETVTGQIDSVALTIGPDSYLLRSAGDTVLITRNQTEHVARVSLTHESGYPLYDVRYIISEPSGSDYCVTERVYEILRATVNFWREQMSWTSAR